MSIASLRIFRAKLRTRKSESLFAKVFLLVTAITLFNGWGTALLVNGAIMMSVYTFHFQEPMRDRHGSLRTAAILTSFLIVVAGVALAHSLLQ